MRTTLSMMISDLLTELNCCLEDHIAAGRSAEAVKLSRRIQKLHQNHVARTAALLGVADGLPLPRTTRPSLN